MSDDIQRSLGRIEGNQEVINARLEKIESKIENLLEYKNKAMGVIIAVSAVVGAFGASIGKAVASVFQSGGPH